MLRLCGPRGVEGLRRLSSRETQLILLASGGLTDKEIARQLGISVGTVITIWSKVRSKLGINSRVAAVAALAWAAALVNGRYVSGFEIYQAAVEGGTNATLVLNHKLVVLTCDQLAASMFDMFAGLTFDISQNVAKLSCLDFQGAPIESKMLPWNRALREGKAITRDMQVDGLPGGPRAFKVKCEVVDDPVFKNLVIVTFLGADHRLILSDKSIVEVWDESLPRAANGR